MRRVAITGLGAVSALGTTFEANWRAVLEGRGGISRHVMGGGEYGPPAFELPLARVAANFSAEIDARLGRPFAAGLDPFAHFVLGPAAEAIQQAGLEGDPGLENAAVILGHGLGGLDTLEAGYARYFGQRSPRVHPATVPKVMVSAGASAVAMAFGVRGPVFVTSSACASSAHAIAQSAGMVATGQVDLAIAGGSEAISTPGSLRAWEALHAMSANTCRPFSTGRDGMVIGEGGAVLILEAFDRAQSRGAPILAEIVGVGMSSDAFHITQPSAEGQARAMRAAVTSTAFAEIGPGDVLVSTHGTGTPLNDRAETESLVQTFGEVARSLPVIATKSAHGHLIGGSAALQAALAIRALIERRAPPILNFMARDPECDLDLILGEARPISARLMIQNAFAFGGLNVTLGFARL